MDKTHDKIALVSGASRGLGAAMAEELAKRGFHIIALARTTGALEELDDRIQMEGGSTTLVPVDITNEDAIKQICRSIHDRWGRIDFWAHTAIHAAPLCPVPHMDEKDFDKTIAINVRATTRLIVNLDPLLRAAPSAKALFFNDPTKSEKFHTTYGLSKAAQMRIARSWAQEAEKIGPEVLVATPEPMPTALRARFYPGENRDALSSCAHEATRILDEVL